MNEARNRAQEAFNKRYQHRKAAREWAAIARENPQRREVCEILARWMEACQLADEEAEKAFRALAEREEAAQRAATDNPGGGR